MSDIKDKLIEFAKSELDHKAWGVQSYDEYYQLNHTLITTIEFQTSQLKETEDWEEDAYAWRDFCESRNNLDEKVFTEDNFTMLYQELEELKTNSKFQIESQKEEIELKDSEYQATITKLNRLTQTINSHGPEGRNYTNQQYVDLLQKFESLKAITELAVKGLQEIIKQYDIALDYGTSVRLAKTTLSEIEKLQNG